MINITSLTTTSIWRSILVANKTYLFETVIPSSGCLGNRAHTCQTSGSVLFVILYIFRPGLIDASCWILICRKQHGWERRCLGNMWCE